MTDQGADRVATVETAVAGLVALIREAPKSKIQAIASADRHAYRDDKEKHLSALREVIEKFDCRLDRQSDNSWFPREPLELVSFGVDGWDVEVVAVANALLMISDLEGNKDDYMSFRWEKSPGEAFFRALPERLGAPLLTGFQLLHDVAEKRGW